MSVCRSVMMLLLLPLCVRMACVCQHLHTRIKFQINLNELSFFPWLHPLTFTLCVSFYRNFRYLTNWFFYLVFFLVGYACRKLFAFCIIINLQLKIHTCIISAYKCLKLKLVEKNAHKLTQIQKRMWVKKIHLFEPNSFFFALKIIDWFNLSFFFCYEKSMMRLLTNAK